MAENHMKIEIFINKDIKNIIKAKQFDGNSRFLDITLVDDDGSPIDLTNCSVRFNGLKADGTYVMNNAVITGAKKGMFTVELTDQTLAIGDSTVVADISVFDEGEKQVLTTRTFSILVQKTIRNDGAMKSSNEYGAVVTLFQDVWDIRETISRVDRHIGLPEDEVLDGKLQAGESVFGALNNFWNYLKEQSTATVVETVDKILQNTSNVRIPIPRVAGDASGVWTAKADMPTVRGYFTSSAVNDKIYCIGGSGVAGSLNEEYNPLTDTWTRKADMPTARYYHTSSAVNNRIYCIGGTGNGANINEEYNALTDTWTKKADMPTARQYLTSSAVNDRIYCIGGVGTGNVANINEEYNSLTNTWTRKTNMPTARYDLISSAVNDKIYCIGGHIDANRVGMATNEEYNPLTVSWTRKADMPTARYNLASSAINDKIYCIGGYGSGVISENEEYNPLSNIWTTKPTMSAARGSLTSSVVKDKIYCLGGSGSKTEAINEVFHIEPIILLPVLEGDYFYTVSDGVYTHMQNISSNEITKINKDGYLYTETSFEYGWIERKF